MISIRNLTRRYGSLTAVSNVSLEIQSGEVVGLLGHNGAGKTTVMKILTGFLEASEGQVSVGGIDVDVDRRGVQRQIGYLPENAPLYPEMLVQQYLRMVAELRELPADRVDGAVGRAVASTGLRDHLLSPIHTLSKGYRQRVGIAQAIVHEPKVLVLDEPTNGLDPVQIQSIRQLIRELASHTTIILSTHILQEIEAVCDRVLVMIGGELAADGELGALLSSHTVGVSLRADGQAGVGQALQAIAGVRSATALGEDPANAGYQAWRLECEPGPSPVPAIVDAAQASGWRIAAAAPEPLTLERYFEQLNLEHVARRSAGAQGAAS
jgi:ABC-2 type transport system ATP-binding protein